MFEIWRLPCKTHIARQKHNPDMWITIFGEKPNTLFFIESTWTARDKRRQEYHISVTRNIQDGDLCDMTYCAQPMTKRFSAELLRCNNSALNLYAIAWAMVCHLWFAFTSRWRHKWTHFPRYWPFVWENHRWPLNFPHKGQWRGALLFSLICARINAWVNNREAGDLRRHRAHYDVTVMYRD